MTAKITFWNVGHGNATLIQTPNKNIVIDLGASSGFSPLVVYKKSNLLIDAVIITHPHADHLGDIVEFDKTVSPKLLRKKHTAEEIRDSDGGRNNAIIEKYIEIDAGYTRLVDDSENPLLSSNNGGVEIESFIPKKNYSNLNNHSLVTFITYACTTVFVPGDNENESWEELLEDTSFTKLLSKTDIMLASHHGRESGYCEEIFDHCNPYLVVISDGSVVGTSVTDNYTEKAKGWNVHKRSDESSKERKCLTTRKDGNICMELSTPNYLYVSID